MKRTKLLVIMSILCAASLLAMILALKGTKSAPAFSPPPFEENAQIGNPPVGKELGYEELDATWFRVGLCGVLRQRDGMAEVWFSNPDSNDVWLKLRILDENGNILGQSGVLRPGEYVHQIHLEQTPEEGSAVIMKVMAYESGTYHSAGAVELHTVIDVE